MLQSSAARLLLAATPASLVLQMALLPVYLHLLLGSGASDLVHPEPFISAFLWLIAAPLLRTHPAKATA